MVDRIQIESDRFRTRNSGGDVTFDSNDKYVKTQTGGNFEFGGYKRLASGVTQNNPSSGTFNSVYWSDNAVGFQPQQNFVSECSGSRTDYSQYGGYWRQWFGLGGYGLNSGNIMTYVGAGNSITDTSKAPRSPGNQLVLFFPIGMDSYTFEESPYGVWGTANNYWVSTNGSSLHNFTGTCDDTGDTFDVNFGMWTDPTEISKSWAYSRGTYRLPTSTLNSLVGSGRTIRATFPDVRTTSYKWHPRNSNGTVNYGSDLGSSIRSSVSMNMLGWAQISVLFKVYGDPINLGLAVTP